MNSKDGSFTSSPQYGREVLVLVDPKADIDNEILPIATYEDARRPSIRNVGTSSKFRCKGFTTLYT